MFESDVQNLKTTLFKVQVAFAQEYDRSMFDELDILAFNKQGSVSNLIIRGDSAKSKAINRRERSADSGNPAAYAGRGFPI